MHWHTGTHTAVDDWLENASNSSLMVMRDHQFHNIPLMGGMWAGRKLAIPDMWERITIAAAGM